MRRELREGERLIIPCPDLHRSECNGYEYCTRAEGGAYCRPDVRTSGFKCPRGYPHHRWELKGYDPEDEEEDIYVEIAKGRQTVISEVSRPANPTPGFTMPKQVPGSPCPSCTEILHYRNGRPVYRCYHGQFQGYICDPVRCPKLKGRKQAKLLSDSGQQTLFGTSAEED